MVVPAIKSRRVIRIARHQLVARRSAGRTACPCDRFPEPRPLVLFMTSSERMAGQNQDCDDPDPTRWHAG